ncbi:MAG: hypothetical protein NC342_04445 [Pseudoflavonifractor sp.]|nr:hypothetical protein [Alloprevotella sp.]MCM1116766.1 hypothetical protein [Pseudoflavonifractor sp.]
MENRDKPRKKTTAWLLIGVLVLIVLLLIWLTVADLFGDTDVAAQNISHSLADRFLA